MAGLDVAHDICWKLLASSRTLCGRSLRLSRALACRLPLL
jgi:hypothetical protein